MEKHRSTSLNCLARAFFAADSERGRGGRGVWGEFRRSEAEAGQFPSKWFRAKFRISHHKILSEFFEPDGSIASRLRRSAGARPALRDATKSHGSPNETETFIRV